MGKLGGWLEGVRQMGDVLVHYVMCGYFGETSDEAVGYCRRTDSSV